MVAAILAGGLGSRLRTVLPDRAKALAQIGEKPFLDLILAQLEKLSFSKVVLCTGHLSHQIRSHYGNTWGKLQVLFSEEREPRGTGGALRLALPFLEDGPVLVTNGDSFYRGSLIPLLDFHARTESRTTILLSKVTDCRRFGRVEAEESGIITRFNEKDANFAEPAWVSAGVYVMDIEVLQSIPEDRQISLENEVFPELIGRGLLGFRGDGDFLDIGTPESYAQAEEFVAKAIRPAG